MNTLHRLALAVALGLYGLPAQAESLRCNGQSTEVGDSRLSVLYKCGEPLLRDSHCAPFYADPNLPLPPAPLLGGVLPCLQVDEWLYERGPGNLTATVRFQFGRVQAIIYGRTPP